jgi:hypothetical protein
VRVVLLLDPSKPLVIVAVGRFDAIAPLVIHEKVDVRAACRCRMQVGPIVSRPT